MPDDETPPVQVAETFYTLQGEGDHVGSPAVFLRLAGCNLLCGDPPDPHADAEDLEPGDDATWVCDSIPVWREASSQPTPSGLVDRWEEDGYLDHLANGAHLVLTGGEPTLAHHQRAMVDVLDELRRRNGSRPYVEVETNGTQPLTDAFDARVDHYTVSLKLANSGMPRAKRLDADAIAQYTERSGTAQFKFVVADRGDVSEIGHLCDDFDITDRQITLMPAGATREQLQETAPVVAEICKERGWDYSPRVHIDIWNAATGV